VVSYQSRTCFNPEVAAFFRKRAKLKKCTDCANYSKKCMLLNAVIQSVYFANACRSFKPR